jgi:Acyl-CoA synthetases (AMP-forming)/AMP-acid ligases II
MVAAILGTFKAGCIHVPLDPRMPAARLQYILNDIAPAAVITEEDLRETVEAYLPPQAGLLLKEDLERILQASAATDYVPGPDVSSPGGFWTCQHTASTHPDRLDGPRVS